jgi:hypothetical protein
MEACKSQTVVETRENRPVGFSDAVYFVVSLSSVLVSIPRVRKVWQRHSLLTYCLKISHDEVTIAAPVEFSLSVIPMFDSRRLQMSFNVFDQFRIYLPHHSKTRATKVVINSVGAVGHWAYGLRLRAASPLNLRCWKTLPRPLADLSPFWRLLRSTRLCMMTNSRR